MNTYTNPRGQEVGYLKDGVYHTKNKHFFRKYQGYGMSDSIIEKLIIDGCKTVHLTYIGKRGNKKLKSNFSQWIENVQKHIDTSMGFEDPQTFVSEKDMEELK